MRRCREKYTAEQREHVRKETRASHLKRLYGLTPDQYDTMNTQQNGLCAICNRPELSSRWKGRLHVDHCHITGIVRGLLCAKCNLAIGSLDDDPTLIMKAAEYVSKSQHITII